MTRRDAVIFLVGLNAVFFGLWRISGEFPFFRNYAKASGVVVESSAKNDGFGEVSAWCPYVLFRYSVGAESFTSHRYGPKTECGEKSYADGIAAHYAPGQTIDIWYDEQSPRFAVITKEISIAVKIMYTAVISVWVVGSILFFVHLVTPGKPRPGSSIG